MSGKSLLLLAAVFLVAPVAFAQTTHVVSLQGATFSPRDLVIEAGDTVEFVNNSGFHNVATTSGPTDFECSAGGCVENAEAAPANATWTASISLHDVGTINYQCDVHFAMNMTGTITVVPADLIFANGFDG